VQKQKQRGGALTIAALINRSEYSPSTVPLGPRANFHFLPFSTVSVIFSSSYHSSTRFGNACLTMRRLPFTSSYPEPRRAYPKFRTACPSPNTQSHSLHFPIFSRRSPLVTRHCSGSSHSLALTQEGSLFLKSFVSPSYRDSLVSPLFPLDTKIEGGGCPNPFLTPTRCLKFFKNFQANSFPCRVFNFLRGGRGYPFSNTHSARTSDDCSGIRRRSQAHTSSMEHGAPPKEQIDKEQEKRVTHPLQTAQRVGHPQALEAVQEAKLWWAGARRH